MRDLTLPGSLEGLLRRGSPVRLRLAPGVQISGVWVMSGTVAARHGGVTTTFEMDDGEGLTLADVSLDLADATGRAHALAWLRGHGGVPKTREAACGLIPEELDSLVRFVEELRPASPAEIASLQVLCRRAAGLEVAVYPGPPLVFCTACGAAFDPWAAHLDAPRWVCGRCLARHALSRDPSWTRPFFTFIPRLGRAQRLDTIGRPCEGVRVYHPNMQAGSACAWDLEEVFVLEEEIFAAPLTEEEKNEERAEWPTGYPSDTGVVVEVFVDKDFPDLTRARFKEPEHEGHGLHYDVTNLWVLTPQTEPK